ncbi:hypothetical protein HCEG_07202 [Histoplasma capsulatum var. duboisii H88]|uniref:Extracellular membrane protein CFEM domain-containing protein n=2 Tax=Ajellomyces capsulatus TaxID=5037 RepID=F0ULN9_AJEC8|nr:hypothetical protein HCDG_08857 [Histoplasma capsulatum H143]EGC47987.1 hypothetical protein HCEG_07202 [Histoplasma capsulatum var. duboisii H88]QSS54135.1 hypothetical protein I7I53_01602 [Histoplasma capsulatum var. duboisii H88]
MRKQYWIPCALFAFQTPTITAISLEDIQPIQSFPPSCTEVYTSEISNCTIDDFSTGACSAACVESLEFLTVSLNKNCVGSQALSATLIGLFFQGLGVQTLCPAAAEGQDQNLTSALPSNTLSATDTRRPGTTQTQTEEPVTTRTFTVHLTTTSETTTTLSSPTPSDSQTLSPPPPTTASNPEPTQTTLKPSATKTKDPNKDPFGGFGNANDIIAPNRAASTSQSLNTVMGIAGVAILLTMQLA